MERVRLAQAPVACAGNTEADQCASSRDGAGTDAGEADAKRLRAAAVQCRASQLAAGDLGSGAPTCTWRTT